MEGTQRLTLVFHRIRPTCPQIFTTIPRFWGVEWPEELYEAAIAEAETLVVLHIAAVFFESWRTSVNLPRAMVTGCKDLPSG